VLLYILDCLLLLFLIHVGYLALSFMEATMPERMGAQQVLSSLLVVKLIASFFLRPCK
jgi:hypothetical protein